MTEDGLASGRQDLSDTLRTISEELPKLRAQVEALPGLQEREKRLTFWLSVVGVVLAVVAIGAGIAIAVILGDGDAKDHAQCVSTNEARAEAVFVWNRLVLPVTVPHGTPAGQQQLASVEAAIAAKFAPHNCG